MIGCVSDLIETCKMLQRFIFIINEKILFVRVPLIHANIITTKKNEVSMNFEYLMASINLLADIQ